MHFMNWDRRTIFKTLTTLLFWAAFLGLFIPFYTELLLAGVFALAMEPFLGRVLQGKHMKWRTSVALILLGMFIVVAVPVTIVIYKLYAYVAEISRTGIQNTPAWQQIATVKTEVVNYANQLMTRFGLSERIDLNGLSEEGLSRGANYLLGVVYGFVYQVPSILLSLFVFCAALYFYLAEAAPLKRIFKRQHVLSATESERFIKVLQKSSYNTVVSSMIIAVMQATVVSLGATILGAGDFTVVWVVTFFCSFVPVIGAGPVAAALALGKVLMGSYGVAIGLMVVAVVGGTMDNIVRPYLISSGEEDLHPVVGLLAIVGALIIFGMPGLFLGPVIATVAIKIIPTLNNEPQPTITASGKDPARIKT